jgi:hypothetical protein
VRGLRCVEISLFVQKNDHDLRNDAAVKPNENRIVDNLLSDAGFGISSNLDDVTVGPIRVSVLHFNKTVWKPAGLD